MVSVVTSSISDIVYLKSLFCLWWIWNLAFVYDESGQRFIHFIFSENEALDSLIFSILLVYISFISAPIFMVSFLQLMLDFVCSSCSSFLRHKVMLLEIFFSGLLRKTFITIIFIFGGAFTQSYRFWIAVLRFHLSPDN